MRREVYEEAGVDVAEVYYHSSQPWPYPSRCVPSDDRSTQLLTVADGLLRAVS
mgnify:FL=1